MINPLVQAFPIPALRQEREGQGTPVLLVLASSKAGPPASQLDLTFHRVPIGDEPMSNEQL